MIINPKGIFVYDRRTGQPVGPVIPIKPSENFYRLPRLDQRVWRYMEFGKFEKLIQAKALYFRRSDRLEDEMEGTYAEANRKYTSALWQKFCAEYPVKHDPKAAEEGALNFRHAVFINCWHINNTESLGMWRRFGKCERSVVIVSTVRKLIQAMEGTRVQPGKVKYASQATPRPEWSHFAPFFFKDTQFMMEKEFRLIDCKSEDETIHIDRDVGRSVAIDLSKVIDLVKLHPDAPHTFKDEIKALLASHNVRLPVSISSLRKQERKSWEVQRLRNA